MGNLTRDVELRYTTSGTPVCDLGVAVNERIKRGEEWVDEAVFVDVTLWGRTAEIAQEYLSKGSPVFIEGRLKLESWETEGQKRSKLKVVGTKLQLIGGRPGQPAQPANDQYEPDPQPQEQATPTYARSQPDDDIPF